MKYKYRLTARVIASRVFQTNHINGKGSGFFLRTPDGIIRALAVTPEKIKRINAKTEVRRLALQLRRRERLRSSRAGRRDLARRAAQRYRDAPRPLSEFFSDNSLAAGDHVVTSSGIKMFRGSSRFPYNAGDFVPAGQQRNGQSKSNIRQLDALERQLRSKR